MEVQLIPQALDRLQGNLDEVQQRSRKELAVKFESLIVSSKLAKTSYLLSRIDKTELYQEKAILYGKVRNMLEPRRGS